MPSNSLSTGVSALQGFQRNMDVVGNNIANSNTVGFKSQRMEFKDSFSNTLNRAVQGGTGTASTANQVGTGLLSDTISTKFNQGTIDPTSVETDIAIEGKGFFRVLDETDPGNPRELFTRAGNFRVNENGFLTTPEGFFVQGQTTGQNPQLNLDVSGSSDGQGVPADGFSVEGQNITDGSLVEGQELALPDDFNGGSGFLGTENGAPKVEIIGDGAGAEAEAIVENGSVTGVRVNNGGSGFTNAVVRIEKPPENNLSFTVADGPQIQGTGRIKVDTPQINLQNIPESSAINPENVQSLAPRLQTFSVGPDGSIEGILDNGERFTMGRVLLQDFRAPQSLSRERGTFFSNPGNVAAEINAFQGADGQPGSGGLGKIQQGALELSNEELTNSFSELIVTQRSFQGAARIITTSDEVLREAVNLKR